jgi:photosystem II stability/assembly factor-like uncharacterized protein
MKSVIISFITSFLMLADLSGQWEVVNNDFHSFYTPPMRWGFSVSDVHFINHNEGFMIGNSAFIHKGRVYRSIVFKTIDGGKVWDSIFSVKGVGLSRFTNCIFIDNLNGYVGSNTGLYQTSNGGGSLELNINGPPNISDLFFVNSLIGFAATDASIYKTTTGGKSWEEIPNCNTVGLCSIFFIDENTGWAVGERGLMMKITGQGACEPISSGTTLPLKKVFFADKNTGWIAGGYNNPFDGLHPVLLKTGDSGGSWSKIENINCLIHDFYFKNDKEGWAVGEDINGKGRIIGTIDGGNNWSVLVGSLSIPLVATDFKDGYGWAIGGNGLILKYDPYYTGINENIEKYDFNTILFQNYPNPFSSRTVIGYQFPVISNIELCVYDITGRKVTTLVKEQQQAGSYEVEWNAEGMTPGIYFCELKAGQNRKIMKMILLK